MKRKYFEVYLFRSALTCDNALAVRRTTVRITAVLLLTGRFRACRLARPLLEGEALEEALLHQLPPGDPTLFHRAT